MATGFRSFKDEPGSPLLVDMTSNLSQMMGFFDTGAVSGAIDVPLPPGGKTFFHLITDISPNLEGRGRRPGTTATNMGGFMRISWTYSNNNSFDGFQMNCRIHYGYYT